MLCRQDNSVLKATTPSLCIQTARLSSVIEYITFVPLKVSASLPHGQACCFSMMSMITVWTQLRKGWGVPNYTRTRLKPVTTAHVLRLHFSQCFNTQKCTIRLGYTIWKVSDCQWLNSSSMTMISPTLPKQWNHSWIDKHTMEYTQTGLPRSQYYGGRVGSRWKDDTNGQPSSK